MANGKMWTHDEDALLIHAWTSAPDGKAEAQACQALPHRTKQALVKRVSTLREQGLAVVPGSNVDDDPEVTLHMEQVKHAEAELATAKSELEAARSRARERKAKKVEAQKILDQIRSLQEKLEALDSQAILPAPFNPGRLILEAGQPNPAGCSTGALEAHKVWEDMTGECLQEAQSRTTSPAMLTVAQEPDSEDARPVQVNLVADMDYKPMPVTESGTRVPPVTPEKIRYAISQRKPVRLQVMGDCRTLIADDPTEDVIEMHFGQTAPDIQDAVDEFQDLGAAAGARRLTGHILLVQGEKKSFVALAVYKFVRGELAN